MEEKILIKSEVNKTLKRILKWGPVVLFGISVLIFILLSLDYEFKYERWDSWYDEYLTITRSRSGWECAFKFNDETIIFFVWFVIACLCLLSAIILGIIYLVNRKCELQVTEKNVKGKTLFGKEVVLPLYMVSAYSTRKFLSCITVATSSGSTKFSLIQNYKEIGEVLSKTINERQENTAHQTIASTVAPQPSAMDELKKLKDLLDMGIISQEEFDAKKKQLLGL